jgi:hypothetical protein
VSSAYPPIDITTARVAIDPFGSFFVAGESATNGGDIWVMKYAGITGEAIWPAPATFNGSGNGADIPLALAVDGHGDVIVTGSTFNGTDTDWVTLKFDGATGALLWGPVIFNGSNSRDDAPVAIAVDSADDVVVTGTSMNLFNQDWATIKYAGPTGAIAWGPVIFNGAFNSDDAPVALTFTPSGDVAVTGWTYTSTSQDWATIKYAGTTGALVWGPALSGLTGTNEIPTGLASDSAGNIFVIGATGGFAGATVAYDSATGMVLWGPVGFANGSVAMAIGADALGDPVVMGQRGRINGSSPSDAPSFLSYGDWVAEKFDRSTGSTVWGPSTIYASANSFDSPFAVGFDSSGDILGAASVSCVYVGCGFLLTAKFDGSTGDVLWGPAIFDGATFNADGPGAMAADASGDVFVLMHSEGANGANPSSSTIKYSGATGAVLWGPVLFPGNPVAITTDTSGNVLVTGSSLGPSGTGDWGTLKYDGTTGAVIWGPVYFNGPSNGNDVPVALAVDGNGNLIVTGYSSSPSGATEDWATIKYDGSSGAVIWGPVIHSSGAPTALAVDAAGNAIVTGADTAGGATIKYSSLNGSIVWGPAISQSVGAFAIALDPAGNVAVAGGSLNSWALLKYDGATGATLWGPVQFPANLGSPTAFASDSSGNLILTGFQQPGGTSDDWATFKVDGGTGGVLWGPIYFDYGGDADFPRALAVDLNDNVLISGESDFSGGSSWASMKYDGSSGSAIWGPLITGTGDSLSRPVSLVTSGNGFFETGVGQVTVSYSPLAATTTTFTFRYTDGLALVTRPEDVPPGNCGLPYSTLLTAANGSTPYTWSISSGSLPPGLSLNGATGEISGSPAGEGVSSFRIRVTDSTTAFAEKDFTMTVFDGQDYLEIVATPNPVCPGGSTTLSVPGSYVSYYWLPGGETTPTITVTVLAPTLFGVVVTDASGCPRGGSVEVTTGPGGAPVITAPNTAVVGATGLIASVPNVPGDTYSWTIVGGTITSNPTLPQITFDAGPAGTTMVLQVSETTSSGCQLTPGTASVQVDFLDVPPSNPFHDYVDTLARNGVTGGCGGGNFCPNANVLRSQMAVFLLRSEHGSSYTPPACGVPTFTDVPCSNPFASWIYQLVAEGVTSGCTATTFCPNDPVTRSSMAVFLLVTEHGAGYTPAACTPPGQFTDVPCPGGGFTDWIYQLVAEGITGGCTATTYCPGSPVLRAQMAVFLTVTFGLP